MIRFFNGKTLLFDKNGIRISNDEVHVSGEKIVYIGPAKTGECVHFDREIVPIMKDNVTPR